MRKIIVIGGAGFTGSAVIRWHLDNGGWTARVMSGATERLGEGM